MTTNSDSNKEMEQETAIRPSAPTSEPDAMAVVPGETITLERDCQAALIPVGNPIHLPAGSVVTVIQALGGSYTVNVSGNLARISAEDADALGLTVSVAKPPEKKIIEGDGTVDEALVWEQLRNCYDPEIPFNIVDLGLIYECSVAHLGQDKGSQVVIRMTLTAPGCGMGEFLVEDVRRKVYTVPNVTEIDVDLTFDPPWSQDMMSEAARLEAGLL